MLFIILTDNSFLNLFFLQLLIAPSMNHLGIHSNRIETTKYCMMSLIERRKSIL